MIIKILGTGCSNCKRLEESTKKAILELGIEAQVEKVTTWEGIMAYGVTALPGLVVDEKLRSFGKVLSVAEIKSLLGNPLTGGFSLRA